MDIKIDAKDEIRIFTNKMKSHIYNNKPDLNGKYNSLAGN